MQAVFGADAANLPAYAGVPAPDGAFGPITGSLDYKWHEVGKYSMRPNFGKIYQFLFVHRGSYARLPADVQKIMADEAAAMEVPGMKLMTCTGSSAPVQG